MSTAAAGRGDGGWLHRVRVSWVFVGCFAIGGACLLTQLILWRLRVFEAGSIAPAGLSTHALTLRVAADFLIARTQARLALLAIQPAAIGSGVGLSKEVSHAVGFVEETLLAILGQSGDQPRARS